MNQNYTSRLVFVVVVFAALLAYSMVGGKFGMTSSTRS
jgi:hypothetical protein